MGRRHQNASALVYFARPVGALGPVKIGCSVYPKHRIKQIAAWSPVDLEIVAAIDGDEVLEARLHRLFLDSHLRLEWFAWSPELQNVIDKINGGTFDVETLPPYAGILNGMRYRLRTYAPIDFEYLEAAREYDRRRGNPAFLHGHVEPARFVLLKNVAEKERLLARLRAFLDTKAAAA